MKTAALWLSLMLVYFLGDVLRIFAGDFEAGKVDGKELPQWLWLAIAVVLLIPIIMMLANVFFAAEQLKYVNIGATVFLFLFNAVGLPSYRSAFDVFLIIVSLVINVAIVVLVW